MARKIALKLSLTLLICVTLANVSNVSATAIWAAEPLTSLTVKSDDGGRDVDHEREVTAQTSTDADEAGQTHEEHPSSLVDYWSLLFVLALSTLIGLGVIVKVSRLLHTPLMSLTNAISAIAVVGAIIVTGGDHPVGIRVLGFIALFASTTNIVSGFMITDRMLKMFKQPGKDAKP